MNDIDLPIEPESRVKIRTPHVEQLDSQVKASGIRKFAKRRSARALRRASKLDPENAPAKASYRGYVS